MATSGLSVFLSALLLLPTGSFAATLHGERDSFVRREPQRSVQMTPTGALVQPQKSAGHAKTVLKCEVCEKKDFILGKIKSNECREGHHSMKGQDLLHSNGTNVKKVEELLDADGTPQKDAEGKRIMVESNIQVDQTMCRYAAMKANAHADPDSTFVITSDMGGPAPNQQPVPLMYTALHPRGCFHQKCHPITNENIGKTQAEIEAGPLTDCYFYNDAEEDTVNDCLADTADPVNGCAAKFSGTPVCMREMYEDADADLPDVDSKTCPEDYKVVGDQTLCGELCGMLDYECHAGEPRQIGIKNFTQHHDFPQGCFHWTRASEGATANVYFNSVSEGTTVQGTPICQVALPLDWNNPKTLAAAGDDANGKSAADAAAENTTSSGNAKVAADKTAADAR